MDTPLEKAIWQMIETFCSYSVKLDDRFTLYRAEMKELLQEEMPNFLEKTENKMLAYKAMDELDENGDEVIEFDEYWNLIGQMASSATHGPMKMAVESKGE